MFPNLRAVGGRIIQKTLYQKKEPQGNFSPSKNKKYK